MTTRHGIDELCRRLNACETVTELVRVWASISYAYQREHEVFQAKQLMKTKLQGLRE